MRGQPIAVLAVVVLAAVSCSKREIPPTKPAVPILGNELLFTSNRAADGLWDLFACNADGSGFHRLTTDSLFEWEARRAPDGSKISVTRGYPAAGYPQYRYNLTVMDGDGANPVRLTDDIENTSPSWSPDGSRISFLRTTNVDHQLWTVNADGTSPTLVADTLDVWDISWTSQDTFLGTDGFGIVLFNTDGSGRTRILSLILGTVYDVHPQMSPDGSKIAFAWSPVGHTKNIYVMNSDGTDVKQLTDNVNESNYPAWSPDGSRIAYSGPGMVLWTMNADGSNQQVVPLPKEFWGNVADYVGDWK